MRDASWFSQNNDQILTTVHVTLMYKYYNDDNDMMTMIMIMMMMMMMMLMTMMVTKIMNEIRIDKNKQDD